MNALEASIDAYGTYARASNLADYIELLALHGVRLTRSDLAAHIHGREWLAKLNELFTGDEIEQREDFDESDEPEDVVPETPGLPEANRVFDMIDQRFELLGDKYPFELLDDELLRDGTTQSIDLLEGTQAGDSPYIALLCMTVAHAYRILTAYDPKRMLEDTVTRVLGAMGCRATNVGDVSRGGGDFRDTITTCGRSVGLSPTPKAAVSFLHANEEGVDCMGRFAGSDTRAGDWVFVGQVTCAVSDQWVTKLSEPKPLDWMDYLNTKLAPQRFLAVPHHADDVHLVKVVKGGQGQVLDRIRLVAHSTETSLAERAIVAEVLDVPVATP